MAEKMNPAVVDHLPSFIPVPGHSDWLFNAVVVFLLIVVLVVGNLYFQLHAVPERMAHRTSKVQIEIVAVLALISLFTHNHIYWIIGLLLAMIEFPDFSTPMSSIAQSLERISSRESSALTDEDAAATDAEKIAGKGEGI
ncbi:hypothetical protein SAMN05428967_1262 [Phyllobacterium sp. YR620]|uniref:hypothetical protein n=1 Tax=Phyllobacterium sp. YR620 TaxID=1881066 RepID=UPI0008900E45|nr:hypothetical protein [Phyllobacterium sp. YR620]SDP11842.1 hypothetical protein SAMN05428967_1262 [Phyllobacterium sp. YR620]